MKEKVREFYDYLSSNQEALKEFEAKAQGAESLSKEAIVERIIIPFAAEKGFEFTIDDVKEFDEESEISLDELEAVSGGAACQCWLIGAAKTCGCFILGGSNSTFCWVDGYNK